MIKAKKQLGQNFLKDNNILEKIIGVAKLNSEDTVLEIGPGLGDLTAKILPEVGKIFAVEKDRDLISKLQEKFESEINSGKLSLLEDDILKLAPEKFGIKNYKIVANIPYYLTGEIFRLVFEKWPTPEKIVFLVQKEVANRIVAMDGKESILSISVKKFGAPKKEFVVKAGSFIPAPKVDSAVISISNIKKGENVKKFFEILKLGFAHKRKTLFKNLSEKFDKQKLEEVFNTCNLDLKIRSEKLLLSDWNNLIENIK